MTPSLTESDWEILIERIRLDRCLPFLGAGVAAALLPLGSAVAQQLASKYNYPFENRMDLIKVSQYVAIAYDSIYPKELLAEKLSDVSLPKPSLERDEPHRLLAKLPLSVYVTTNYDSLMFQALSDERKNPRKDFCRWRDFSEQSPSSQPVDYKPTVANPLVFHMHGYAQVPESMVLTEDDYLEFLNGWKERGDLLPDAVTAALAGRTLLFIGYQLADWNFRVILRSLPRMHLRNFAVMPLPDGGSVAIKERSQKYLSEYYGRLNISMYWGTAKDFLCELWKRGGKSFE